MELSHTAPHLALPDMQERLVDLPATRHPRHRFLAEVWAWSEEGNSSTFTQ